MTDRLRPTAAPAEGLSETSPWQRTLWGMVGVQFVMSLAFTILSPIMPLYLPELGVQHRAAIDLWAGALTSVTPLLAAFFSPLWGRMADRKGRKLMVLRSSLAIAIFTALMGVAQTAWHLFALRAMMGVFAGFSAAAITLVASQVPDRKLGFALGWLSTGQLVGNLAGPLVGGAIADLSGSYRVPFLTAGALSFGAFLLAWAFVPEQFVPSNAAAHRKPGLRGVIAVFSAASGLGALVLVLLLAQFGVQAVQPVVTLFVQQLVGNRPELATLAGAAFSATGIADVIASPFLGKRSDTLGYRRVLLICLAGAALATLPQAFVHSYTGFVIGRFGVGLFVGGILPTANALIGRLAGAGQRGFVYGISASAMFLGSALGPLSGGVIAATIGIRFVFVVTASLLTINLVWVWFTVPAQVDEPGA
ncbi:MAG: MFS transporter [Rhodospirillales bacterium]|nr:MFS transporter [Rhodospirillales bacterium]